MFTFFTEAIQKGVVDKNGRWIGYPCDFLVGSLGEPYPAVSALVISKGVFPKHFAIIPWSQVQRTNEQFHIKLEFGALEFKNDISDESATSIKKHILDQQVVDTFNRKVVRVNDVHFLKVDNYLRIAHVDIGLRGMVRRLGWQTFIDSIVGLLNPHALYLKKEGFLAWKYVQPLSITPDKGTIQLNVSHAQIKSIPPPDLSEMLKEIDPYQRAALFRTLDIETQVEIVTEMEAKLAKELVHALDGRTCAALFERMPSDEGTDLLGRLSRRDKDRILTHLSSKKAKRLSSLLSHKSNSAGGLMAAEFITLSDEMTVADAIEHIKEKGASTETIYYAYVVNADNKLEGVVTFKQLLIEPLDKKISDIMQTKPVCVHVSDGAKEVAYLLDKYNLLGMPVIDDKGILVGIITIDDVLSLVISETWGKKTGLL